MAYKKLETQIKTVRAKDISIISFCLGSVLTLTPLFIILVNLPGQHFEDEEYHKTEKIYATFSMFRFCLAFICVLAGSGAVI